MSLGRTERRCWCDMTACRTCLGAWAQIKTNKENKNQNHTPSAATQEWGITPQPKSFRWSPELGSVGDGRSIQIFRLWKPLQRKKVKRESLPQWTQSQGWKRNQDGERPRDQKPLCLSTPRMLGKAKPSQHRRGHKHTQYDHNYQDLRLQKAPHWNLPQAFLSYAFTQADTVIWIRSWKMAAEAIWSNKLTQLTDMFPLQTTEK